MCKTWLDTNILRRYDKGMSTFTLFASPWWVNLFIFVPFISCYLWRKGLSLSWRTLAVAALFGLAFGFVEAAVVIYLRAAIGLLPGIEGSLSDVVTLSLGVYEQSRAIDELPESLYVVELIREAATIVMLAVFALTAVRGARERLALFFWIFATWDIFYYIGLWSTVRWPFSLLDNDVLFLIPVPWFSQAWYPILVSVLLVVAVAFGIKKPEPTVSR